MIALLAIEPLLIPLILIVLIPAWLVASRRGDAFFRFFWTQTPRERERNYLGGLLTDREAAKEVRGFGLAAELRRVARRQLRFPMVAHLGTGVVLGGTLLLIAWRTLSGRVPLSQAGIAVAGVVQASAYLE